MKFVNWSIIIFTNKFALYLSHLNAYLCCFPAGMMSRVLRVIFRTTVLAIAVVIATIESPCWVMVGGSTVWWQVGVDWLMWMGGVWGGAFRFHRQVFQSSNHLPRCFKETLKTFGRGAVHLLKTLHITKTFLFLPKLSQFFTALIFSIDDFPDHVDKGAKYIKCIIKHISYPHIHLTLTHTYTYWSVLIW